MKVTKSPILLVFLLMILLLPFAGCGGGDDDDDRGALDDDAADDDFIGDDDDDTVDDDSIDDDTVDDDSVDDDTIDDDSVDDDSVDDDSVDDDTTPDVEYDSIVCQILDPEALGEGIMIGGGSPTTQIDVYVYDDGTCAPLVGATVLYGTTKYFTDGDGYVAVPVTDAVETVTAYAPNSWAWTYKADAAVMYFRLRPDAYNRAYGDSAAGDFLDGGTPLGLTNPSLADLLTDPVFFGVTTPGISRKDALSFDDLGLFPTATFDFEYNFGDPMIAYMYRSVYLPAIDITLPIVGYYVQTAGNTQYVVPVDGDAEVSPIEGLVAGIDIGAAIPTLDDLGDLLACLGGGGNILECLAPILVPAVNDALAIYDVGANPTWDGTGAPNIDVVSPLDKATIGLTIANTDADLDYLAILGGDVPNRALLPTGIKFAEDGAAAMDWAEFSDADYIAAVGATDMLVTGFVPLSFSFAFQYAENIDDWIAGIAFDADTDFLPLFDADNTGFNAVTGEISWALAKSRKALSPDLYFVVYAPACTGCKVIFAQVPATDSSFTVPIDEMEITPSEDDIVGVFGFVLPDEVDINEYSPVNILGYNVAAINGWSNFDLTSITW